MKISVCRLRRRRGDGGETGISERALNTTRRIYSIGFFAGVALMGEVSESWKERRLSLDFGSTLQKEPPNTQESLALPFCHFALDRLV